MAQDPDATTVEAIEELADELLRAAESIAQTVAHLLRWAATATAAPDTEPADVVLRRVLREVLAHILTGHTVPELLDAAGLVSCATVALDRDILLLQPEPTG